VRWRTIKLLPSKQARTRLAGAVFNRELKQRGKNRATQTGLFALSAAADRPRWMKRVLTIAITLFRRPPGLDTG
jgi:hypothetical protein